MSDLNILNSLIENNSIQVKINVKDWEEAIYVSSLPLINSGAITIDYCASIIEFTKKYGAYYIIAPLLAMPHASGKEGEILKNSFAIATLKNPIKFYDDDRDVQLIIILAAKDANVHVSVAIPQIVKIFENEENIKKIIECNDKKEIINIIKSVDFSEYLV